MEAVTFDVDAMLKIIDETEVCWASHKHLFDNACCVGGALCKQIKYKHDSEPVDKAFPDVSTLTDALCMVNPNLPISRATLLAVLIINQNDTCQFQKAKRTMKEALTFK